VKHAPSAGVATALAVALALLARSASRAAGPPVPYFDWNACPFECCFYGTWTAERSVPALAARRADAPTAFTVEAGERVTAWTGVVVTTRPGRIRIVETTKLGEGKEEVELQPGDVVYVLHYLGEGFDLLWFRARRFSDQIHMERPGKSGELELLEPAETEWWVKVKNRAGRFGWTNEPESFPDNDACGD